MLAHRPHAAALPVQRCRRLPRPHARRGVACLELPQPSPCRIQLGLVARCRICHSVQSRAQPPPLGLRSLRSRRRRRAPAGRLEQRRHLPGALQLPEQLALASRCVGNGRQGAFGRRARANHHVVRFLPRRSRHGPLRLGRRPGRLLRRSRLGRLSPRRRRRRVGSLHLPAQLGCRGCRLLPCHEEALLSNLGRTHRFSHPTPLALRRSLSAPCFRFRQFGPSHHRRNRFTQSIVIRAGGVRASTPAGATAFANRPTASPTPGSPSAGSNTGALLPPTGWLPPAGAGTATALPSGGPAGAAGTGPTSAGSSCHTTAPLRARTPPSPSRCASVCAAIARACASPSRTASASVARLCSARAEAKASARSDAAAAAAAASASLCFSSSCVAAAVLVAAHTATATAARVPSSAAVRAAATCAAASRLTAAMASSSSTRARCLAVTSASLRASASSRHQASFLAACRRAAASSASRNASVALVAASSDSSSSIRRSTAAEGGEETAATVSGAAEPPAGDACKGAAALAQCTGWLKLAADAAPPGPIGAGVGASSAVRTDRAAGGDANLRWGVSLGRSCSQESV
eukprot:scaffold2382_cov108-Isochrysis_galbana.AAC.3